jgi:PAS domain S-box-containing protein
MTENLTQAYRKAATGKMDRSRLHTEAAQSVRARVPLQHVEASFRLFVDAVQDYAIYMLDPRGYVATWNRGAERIKGYSEDEIVGQHFSVFFPQADRDAQKPEKELAIAAREGRFEDEAWRVRKDGSLFWASVILTAVRDSSGELIGFGKVTRDITERMRAEGALRQSNQELGKQIADRIRAERMLQQSEESLRRLSLSLLRSQDEERRRIGRDLHDSVGQYLAALKMNLDALTSNFGLGNGETGEVLRQCTGLAAESIKEVRTISYLLYPPMLEESGLESAIQWYLEGFSKRSGIQISFDPDADFGRLSRDAELAIFRVLQESLTNVHRHSGSTTAKVALRIVEGQVVLDVADAGKGIPAETLEEARKDSFGALGVGLRGMKERMRQLGGDLELSSSAAGTMLTARLPAEAVQRKS